MVWATFSESPNRIKLVLSAVFGLKYAKCVVSSSPVFGMAWGVSLEKLVFCQVATSSLKLLKFVIDAG